MENNLKMEFVGEKHKLEKYNVYLSDLDYLNDYYKITLTKNTYKKLGRKHFPKKPTETETEYIDARQYAIYISSIGYHEDRVTKRVVQWGQDKPTKLVSTRPDKEVKVERIFTFEYIGR